MQVSHLDVKLIDNLTEKSTKIRKHIIQMIGEAGSGHPGGALSATDLVTALYFHFMNLDVNNPKWEDRDRFILSKGHASAVLYAVLAEKGFNKIEELIETYKRTGSRYAGHPDMNKVPGVDMTTGSLGQGLSVANGMAISGKYDHKKFRVYVMLGDGEIQEGQVWEAAMVASHYNLDNITAFVDRNRLQITGETDVVMNNRSISDKWKSFGWHVIEIDGHCMGEIINSINEAQSIKGKPTMILANTVKGKGVSFMENQVDWHGKAPNKEQLMQALKELGE
ncbi:transketolase [Bacillus sp. Marseille-P3661]|uniref:transketolase n=1 Tax=Bacillus sp. Marseille-P3661 TaxID=1936234 RepID=UPI000C82C53D|nr:transketolase [Bacillus sp. Marseille-P3661]